MFSFLKLMCKKTCVHALKNGINVKNKKTIAIKTVLASNYKTHCSLLAWNYQPDTNKMYELFFSRLFFVFILSVCILKHVNALHTI